jgi:hypothetical protein
MMKHRAIETATNKLGTHCAPIDSTMAEPNDLLTQLNYLS